MLSECHYALFDLSLTRSIRCIALVVIMSSYRYFQFDPGNIYTTFKKSVSTHTRLRFTQHQMNVKEKIFIRDVVPLFFYVQSIPMDSRGIPIVIPAKKCNTTPKRITTPKRYDTPLSPFFIRNIKNEFSLLDAYDDFYDSRFSSRYHPTSDDMRHNVRDLYKSNMFTEISSPRPPKRMRSSFFMDSDMMDDELPHLEASKKPPKDMTVSSPVEAMTPLADDALDTLHGAPAADLDLHTPAPTPAPTSTSTSTSTSTTPAPAAAAIPTRTRSTRRTKQETLVEPSQQQQQIVTPKSLLKPQDQAKSGAPQTPLPPPPDNSVNEMPIRQKSATLKQPAKSPAVKPATHVQASPQRLTRRQARLIEENGGKPDFAVPKALPTSPSAPKRNTRASKRKPSLPKQVEAQQEMQPLEAPIVDQVPPVVVDDDTPEPATIEQQPETPPKVVNAEKVTDVDIHDTPEAAVAVADVDIHDTPEAAAVVADVDTHDTPEAAAAVADVDMHDTPEAATEPVMEAPQEQQQQRVEPINKAEKSEKELQQEKLQAYRKKKSDAEIQQILQEFPQIAQYYQLIERAGSGTFSRVYKAKDLLVDEYMPSAQAKKVADALGHQQDDADAHYVAIKLIFDISTPERVANEIRCLSMLA